MAKKPSFGKTVLKKAFTNTDEKQEAISLFAQQFGAKGVPQVTGKEWKENEEEQIIFYCKMVDL